MYLLRSENKSALFFFSFWNLIATFASHDVQCSHLKEEGLRKSLKFTVHFNKPEENSLVCMHYLFQHGGSIVYKWSVICSSTAAVATPRCTPRLRVNMSNIKSRRCHVCILSFVASQYLCVCVYKTYNKLQQATRLGIQCISRVWKKIKSEEVEKHEKMYQLTKGRQKNAW